MTEGTRRIRALVVDDEALARASLRILMASDPEIALVGECESEWQMMAAVAAHRPELLFLDIQLAGTGPGARDGFDLLERLPKDAAPAVVFVTAHHSYAIRAFEVNALDYLVKPFDDERFARTLRRAKAYVRAHRVYELAGRLADAVDRAPPERSSPTAHLDRIVLREGKRIAFLPVSDIDWIEAEDYYAQIHAGDRTHLLRQSLNDLEKRLDPARFARIHRSAIVSLDRITELRCLPHGEYVAVLRDGTTLKVSRTHRRRLADALALR